jgi:hypothetical protein
MKTWLKSGLIVAIIFAILVILSGSIENTICDKVDSFVCTDIIGLIYAISFFPTIFTLFLFYGTAGLVQSSIIFWTLTILSVFIFYFLLGSILGLLIQKIKSK